MGPRTMQSDVPPAEGVQEWFAGRLPDEWFEGAAGGGRSTARR